MLKEMLPPPPCFHHVMNTVGFLPNVDLSVETKKFKFGLLEANVFTCFKSIQALPEHVCRVAWIPEVNQCIFNGMCWRGLLDIKCQCCESACEGICDSIIYFHWNIPRQCIPSTPDCSVCGAHGPCCPARRLDHDLQQTESDHSQVAGCLGAGVYLNQKVQVHVCIEH